MAIVSVNERFQDRDYTEEYGHNGGATYRTSWVVRCDARSDGPLVARTAPGLPVLGRTTVTTTVNGVTRILTCSKVGCAAEQEDDLVFVLPIEFTLKSPDEADIQPNPLLRKPDVDWVEATESVVLYEDRDGNPMQSSAGQQYDPPVEETRPVLALVYQDNVASYDPTLAAELKDSVNNSSVSLPVGILGDRRSVPAGCAYCQCYTASTGYENGIYFMRRRIEIHVKPSREDGESPWLVRILDQGTYELTDDDPPVRKIIKVNGQNTNAPVTLDGAGHAMLGEVAVPQANGDVNIIVTGDQAVFLPYRTKRYTNFGAFALRFP